MAKISRFFGIVADSTLVSFNVKTFEYNMLKGDSCVGLA